MQLLQDVQLGDHHTVVLLLPCDAARACTERIVCIGALWRLFVTLKLLFAVRLRPLIEHSLKVPLGVTGTLCAPWVIWLLQPIITSLAGTENNTC
jgi:hypothetical protein